MSDTTTTEATDKEQAMAPTTPPDGTPPATAMKALNPAPAKASTKKATPKKATKPTAKPTTKAAPAPKLEANKVDRIKAATAEAKAAKAAGWKRNKDAGEWERVEGRKAKPPTPNLDAINAGDGGSSTTKEAKAPKRAAAAAQTVRLFHDGKPMPDSQNKLSSVAYYYTKGIGGEKVARITTDALRTLVAKESGVAVDDLSTTAWSVKLPNGVKLSAKVERKASTSKAA